MRAAIGWLVDHTIIVLMAVFVIFVFGLYAYVSLPRESNPDITIPVVLVTTPYVGVAPQDVETLLTIPLERELSSLRDVKALKSTSAEGVSIVSIEFDPGVDIGDALQKVRDRVSKARPSLPGDAKETEVREISFSDIPVLLINIAGPVDEEVLKKLGEDLEDAAARIPGVLEAKVSGGLTREIRLQVFPERLGHYGLSLRDVIGAVSDENVNIPGGTVSSGRSNFLLRVPGEFVEPQRLEEVAVKRVGDMPVFVRDIAMVVDGYRDRETYARMNGTASVSVSATKRAGANILEVAQALKELAAEQAKTWPEGVTYRVLGDQSKAIEMSVADLQNNIISSLLLVVAVVIVFMGFRNSVFVGVSIPLSMLMSLAVLQLLGYTLNMVVLFSLMLALGMLVDNAIVVVENIYRHMEMGKTARDAAVDGTSEVALAVAASTATTIAAFFPLLFWGGIMGQFMGFLPTTVIIVLSCSLLVAIGILPVFAATLMRAPVRPPTADDDGDLMSRRDDLSLMMRSYRWVLEWSIRLRYLSLLGGGGVFVVTLVIFALFNHGLEFFPVTEPDRAIVAVKAAEGTGIEETDRIVRRVEALLAQERNVDVWVAETGVSGTGNALAGAQSSPHEARITVDFLPHVTTAMPGETPRYETTDVTIDRLRQVTSDLVGAHITVEQQEMGPPVGKAIQVEVRGPTFESVGEAALRLQRAMARIPGVTDLSNDFVNGRPEMQLRIDRGAAKRVGVSSNVVGDTVRTAVAGTKASAFRDGDDEVDIVVELHPAYRTDLQSVLGLRLPGREDTSPNTFAVPLSTVASYELAGGSGAVKHVDQSLVVTILGDVMVGYNENELRLAVKGLIGKTNLGPGISAGLAGSNQEQEDAIAFLSKAFGVAVLLILIVLVLQFDRTSERPQTDSDLEQLMIVGQLLLDRLAMPLIILATVTLSLIGVLWGLLITGTPFGVVMTGIGVISLAGVVVNNAIVLLDYVLQLRDRGLSVHDSLVEAGLTRFRPVMLTAITTGLGLMPMALAISIDFFRLTVVVGAVSAQMWGPMAVAVIFGLLFATVLTLVMVPTLYSIYDDFDRLMLRLRGALFRRSPVSAAVVTAGSILLVAGLGVLTPRPAAALSLDDAFRSAEENNLDLKLLREQTYQTSLNRGRAWSALSPRLTTNAQYIVNEQEIVLDFGADLPPIPGLELGDPIIVQRKTFWQAQARVSQRVFSGSALPGLRGAYAQTNAARSQEAQQRNQLRLGVAQLFYQVVTSRLAEALAERALVTSQAQLELAQKQVEAGLAADRAVLQARLAASRAQRDIDQSREGRTQAELAFARATGLAAEAALELPEPPVVPASVEVAVEQAMSARPDLHAAEQSERAARMLHVGSTLAWMPTVDASFTYNYTQNLGFQTKPTLWQVALVGTWDLWDGGMRLQDQREAASQKRSAQYQSEQLRQTAEEDVRVAWEAWIRSEQALRAVEEEVDLAKESLALAEASFSAGTATWLDVEQAQLSVLSSELNQLRERMSRDLAAWSLRAATGVM